MMGNIWSAKIILVKIMRKMHQNECLVDYNCLLFFICLCFFSACKEEQENSTVEVIKITLLEKSNIYIPADSIFESAEYIALETTEDNLLSGLESLSVQLQHDTLYIWDRDQQELSQYDEQGRYLQKLSRRGNGPGEYISVSDFVVLDTMVCLLAGANKKIMFYRKSDFSHVGDLKIPINVSRMKFYEGFLYLYSGLLSSEYYNMYVMDMHRGKILSRYKPYQQEWKGAVYSRTIFNKSTAYNYYTEPYNYHIYEAMPDGDSVVFRLDFGKENMYDSEFLLLSPSAKRIYLQERYSDPSDRLISGIDNLYFSDQMRFFTFTFGTQPYWYINIKGKAPMAGYICTSKKFPWVSAQVHSIDEDNIYSLESADYVCEWKERLAGTDWIENVPEWLLSKIKFDDNPVLCRYKLKK